MRLAGLPGLSVAVVERGSVTWRQTFGVLNAATKDPVREDSLFEAASMSKPVFAYGVLRLADEKKIDLDRPLVTYYKPAYLPDDPYLRQITARHVLTHTSGLPNWGDEDRPDSLKPAFRPGRFFTYSGEGFFWLQLVVERITEQGLDSFMRSRLFEPAGMSHSTYVGDAEHAPAVSYGHEAGRVAARQGWRDVLDRILPLAREWGKPLRDWTQDDWLRASAELVPNRSVAKRVRFENSASSLLTTATDYARFLTLVMERSPHASWEISEATRRAMIAPQIAVQENVPFWWGLGWALERCPDGWRFSHEGNNDGRFTSYAGGDPARGRGMVILANGGSGFPIYQRIVRAATGCDQLSFIANVDPPPDI